MKSSIKQTLMVIALMFVSNFLLAAQGLQVSKSPGDSVTIAWSFTVASEAQIDGFALQSSALVDGPYTDVKTVLKASRSTTAVVGSTPVFYTILSYKTGTPRQESVRSNPVAVAIVLPPPVGLGAN